jgi:hypothetical protein
VTHIIKEVISGRKKSARWFSRQAGDTTSTDFEESNLGHQHFIEILEKVLEILSRCDKSGKATTVVDNKDNSNDDEDDPLAPM